MSRPRSAAPAAAPVSRPAVDRELAAGDGVAATGVVSHGDGRAASASPASAVTGDAVATFGLTKMFKTQTAVHRLDLRVPRGAVYGFLGPNGSGKTTTIRMLVGLVAPSSGRHTLLDRAMPGQAAQVLPRVGALIEGPAFHPYLSGRANLLRLAAADRYADPRTATTRVDRALDRVGLLVAARKRYRAYSLGMRQRLAIAATLLQPRDLLILDEPTNGLDPQGTREVRSLIAELHAGGTTVLISSHLLSEIEQICSHIGIMHAGRLITQGPVEEVRGAASQRVRVDTPDAAAAMAVLAGLGLTEIRTGPRGAGATLGRFSLAAVMPAMVAAGVPVLGFGVDRPTLEDQFVALTGEGFDVSG